jgi:hypothetical protein
MPQSTCWQGWERQEFAGRNPFSLLYQGSESDRCSSEFSLSTMKK